MGTVTPLCQTDAMASLVQKALGMYACLHRTVGAKTRKVRTTSLTYARDGGGPGWPGWYHNVKANPDIEINAGRKCFAVTAQPCCPATRTASGCGRQTGVGASVSDVAEYMAVEHSTASRTVGAVVAAGLLTKEYASDDQRRCVLVLTDIGRKALAAVTVRRRELVAETITDWPDADVDTLVALLERLTERFEFQGGR
jgi:deazaflavin-dependent oxidoreductase (nitroreductase family)